MQGLGIGLAGDNPRRMASNALVYTENNNQQDEEHKMNKDRRKQIDEAGSVLQDALALIEQIRDDEQEAFDNMPESLQQSDRGTASDAAIEELDDAAGNLQYIIDTIDNAKGE